MDAPIWFLRVDDTRIRGPVPLMTLRQWAEDGTLNAEDEVSSDARIWQPAATVPALEMEWLADMGNGHAYGPINLLAARFLVERGILKPDSVLRRRSLRKDSATTVPSPVAVKQPDLSRPTVMASDDSGGARIGQMEHDLQILRRELATLHGAQASHKAPSGRALTATAIETGAASHSVDTLFDKVEHTERMLERLVASHDVVEAQAAGDAHAQPVVSMVPRARPVMTGSLPTIRLSPFDEAIYDREDPEEMREIASTRRFRIQTLRWNIINGSMVIGTGVVVGAVGYMLENDPVNYTGLVLAFLGLAYFGIAMALLLGRKVSAWAHLVVERDADGPVSGPPIRGALNITFFWFSRKFRGRRHG